MNNIVGGLIGFGLFAGFVGFLALRIGEWPLGIIILLAIVLAVVDLVQDIKGQSR